MMGSGIKGDSMNFSENISNKLMEVIVSELNYNEDKKEIITYAIETTLLTVIGLFSIIFLGYLFNALRPTIIAAFFGSSLRRVSGGAHFETPLKCLVIGSLAYSFLGVLANQLVIRGFNNKSYLLGAMIISLFLVFKLAPVDSKAKPIYSGKLKLKLKILSIGFVIVSFVLIGIVNNYLFCISATFGVLHQSLTLITIFNKEGGV